MTSMKICGGNEVRPDDQPEDGGRKLMTVTQIEPREELPEEDDCGDVGEDAFNATKIDGKSLEPCNKPKDEELTAKNMADFDGAFLSLKISKQAIVKEISKSIKNDKKTKMN